MKDWCCGILDQIHVMLIKVELLEKPCCKVINVFKNRDMTRGASDVI